MKRLMTAAEINKLVFGSPSLQLGNDTITRQEAVKAIFNNPEIRARLSEKQYKKVMLDIPNLSSDKANYANYGCYGSGEDAQFYAIEVYKFETGKKEDEFLYIIIGKPFTCTICSENLDEETPDDVIVDYMGEAESDYFFGSYNDYMNKASIDFNEKKIDLIMDIPINTPPETFYIKYLRGEL